jgi:N-acetyl-anhydromuramyl-L-alanine amidase AmpD
VTRCEFTRFLGLAAFETILGAQTTGKWAGSPNILQTPITFTRTREDLTLQYIRKHYDRNAIGTTIIPKMIVLHWTAGPTAESALATFASERLPPGRAELLRGGDLNVSAHFLVSQDGTIRQLMPVTKMARHVIGLNHVSIGIENVGGPRLPLTSKQLAANEALIRYLVTQLPSVRYLIGHFEATGFRGTPLWIELMKGYQDSKIDPGAEFMDKVRKAVMDLGLYGQYRQ